MNEQRRPPCNTMAALCVSDQHLVSGQRDQLRAVPTQSIRRRIREMLRLRPRQRVPAEGSHTAVRSAAAGGHSSFVVEGASVIGGIRVRAGRRNGPGHLEYRPLRGLPHSGPDRRAVGQPLRTRALDDPQHGPLSDTAVMRMGRWLRNMLTYTVGAVAATTVCRRGTLAIWGVCCPGAGPRTPTAWRLSAC